MEAVVARKVFIEAYLLSIFVIGCKISSKCADVTVANLDADKICKQSVPSTRVFEPRCEVDEILNLKTTYV